MKKTLYELSAEAEWMEQVLEENGGELTPELEEALTLNKEQLMQKADNICTLIRKFEAVAEACKAEKKRVNDLQSSSKKAADRLKGMVLLNMGTFGISKLEGNTCTMSRRRSEQCEVNDEALLAGYQHNIKALQESLPEWAKVKVEVDKTILKKQMKEEGIQPQGAQILENFSLIIK